MKPWVLHALGWVGLHHAVYWACHWGSRALCPSYRAFSSYYERNYWRTCCCSTLNSLTMMVLLGPFWMASGEWRWTATFDDTVAEVHTVNIALFG